MASSTTLAIAVGGARVARSQAPCATVQTRGELPAAWADAVRELQGELAELPGTECQPQMLSIERTAEGVRIVAIAKDGRRAERAVRHPAALAATGLGLVMSIPIEAAPTPTPSPTPSPARATAGPRPSTPPVSAWAGLALGGRVAAPGSITMADVEARIDVLLGRWLVFAAIRDVPLGLQVSQGVEADPYRELGAGIGVGRRFALGGATAIDVGVEPSLAVMRMEIDLPQPQPAGQEGIHGDDVELRVGLFARLALPLSSAWQLSVTADTDVAPSNLFTPTRIDVPAAVVLDSPVPPFPAWTSGLRLGMSGELL